MPEGARWERHHVMYHRKDWLRTRDSSKNSQHNPVVVTFTAGVIAGQFISITI